MKRIMSLIIMVALFFVSGLFAEKNENEKADKNLQKLTKITMEQAQKIALIKAFGQIVSSELEVEDGYLMYSFDVKTEKGIMEVAINAKDGSVIEAALESAATEKKETTGEKKEKESEIKGSIPVKGKAALASLVKISEKDAQVAACKIVEGSIKATQLEKEDGFLVYNIIVVFEKTEYEVLVDAGNAQVLTIEVE